MEVTQPSVVDGEARQAKASDLNFPPNWRPNSRGRNRYHQFGQRGQGSARLFLEAKWLDWMERTSKEAHLLPICGIAAKRNTIACDLGQACSHAPNAKYYKGVWSEFIVVRKMKPADSRVSNKRDAALVAFCNTRIIILANSESGIEKRISYFEGDI
ncbi:hypothetical protein CIHG_05874 [Coccidioides immitis H538.4]|uniref:Uncharacterized protein n=3 Tax=Coccidioides immitis TaxID=5501 RepID=A0A0J8U4U3_COCIT|nr:hypothetical protein CIRG_01936 [Coccidioides immitis RMSCC 2394]KMU81922.1 hypothetical protein CISG_09390 [Coccidioides immitis RMSCC 3703]KMU88106.1 hypothetical protein CIHG_05874 [Coccidioides immitis H538.4]